MFQLKTDDLNFHSSDYDWLVIAGAKAMYKGTGTINGEGNYGFMLSAIDEKETPSTDVDLFRIKIWDKDNGDTVVYDNQMGGEDDADPTTEIGGGNIVVHKDEGGNNTAANVGSFQGSSDYGLWLWGAIPAAMLLAACVLALRRRGQRPTVS